MDRILVTTGSQAKKNCRRRRRAGFSMQYKLIFRRSKLDADNTIVYSDLAGVGIMRVPSNGGTPEYAVKRKLKEMSEPAVFPQLLPDGKSVLFTRWIQKMESISAHIMVQPPEPGEPKELFEGYAARYIPTDI